MSLKGKGSGSDDDDSSDWSSSDGGELEACNFHSLCNPSQVFSTLEDALCFDREEYQFDALALLPTDDFYHALRFVNFCRRVRKSCDGDKVGQIGEFLREEIRKRMHEIVAPGDQTDGDCDDDIMKESLYRPIIDSDGFIINLDEFIAQARAAQDHKKGNENKMVVDKDEGDDKDELIEELRSQITTLHLQLEDSKKFISLLGSEKLSINLEKERKESSSALKKKIVDNDSYYFKSYSHYGIHEQMLKDTVRTSSYEQAILGNPNLFQDKVVLDVGCGTGVLSIFAAKAGAKKVISVDDSNMVHQAQKIVAANNFEDVIILMKGKIENIELPVAKGEVDVVISEWMGYALFFETMLPSVISARDRYMSVNGTMFPNACQIFLEGGQDRRLNYWNDVYGIDMRSMRGPIELELASEAQVEKFDNSSIVTNRVKLVGYDLNCCTDNELDFEVPFRLDTKDGLAHQKIDVFVVSFDIDFDHNCTKPITFSTGCQSTTTHWYQTVLWLEPSVAPTLISSNGEAIVGVFKMSRNITNPREIDFHVKWKVVDHCGTSKCCGSIRSRLAANA